MTIVDLATAWFHLHLRLDAAAWFGLWPLALKPKSPRKSRMDRLAP